MVVSNGLILLGPVAPPLALPVCLALKLERIGFKVLLVGGTVPTVGTSVSLVGAAGDGALGGLEDPPVTLGTVGTESLLIITFLMGFLAR